jgi:hypothetical protein
MPQTSVQARTNFPHMMQEEIIVRMTVSLILHQGTKVVYTDKYLCLIWKDINARWFQNMHPSLEAM